MDKQTKGAHELQRTTLDILYMPYCSKANSSKVFSLFVVCE
jgi:hypothetical protein